MDNIVTNITIGNWYLVRGKPTKISPANVVWAYRTGCFPIPLTEELLQRLFPDPDEITWFPLDEKKGFFNIYWEHSTFGEGELRLEIQYVHQLQDAMRLCNIKKEIEL